MIIISEFPEALELNEMLYDRVCENLEVNVVSISKGKGCRRTGWNLHKQNIKEIDRLISWIQYMLPEVSKNFAAKDHDEKTEFGYTLSLFEVAECWGIHYNKNESIVEHNHFPFILSFIYYIRTPEGAAPIIVENNTYEVEEGKCIFFLASQWHSVNKNNCQGRCAIVGNISYRN